MVPGFSRSFFQFGQTGTSSILFPKESCFRQERVEEVLSLRQGGPVLEEAAVRPHDLGEAAPELGRGRTVVRAVAFEARRLGGHGIRRQ